MQLAHLLLTTLLALYRPPIDIRHRLESHHDRIVEQATAAAERHAVPVGVLLAVGFLETHLGQDAGEGGGWGAPIDRYHRHIAGTPDTAASALAWGFRRCRSWLGAVSHYRCGLCACRRLVGYDAPTAIRIVVRLHDQSGMPLPEHLVRP